jgi:metal transporter CNNM
MRSLSFLGCTLSILSLRLLPSQAEPAAENDQLITQLIDRLKQAGIDGLCHPLEDHSPFFPRCSPLMDAAESISANPTRLLRGTVTRPYRLLQEQQEEESIEPAVHKTDWTSIILAAICVLSAAVCAGLIMGILSLDEFMLHIKIRAGTDPVEQKQAEMLLPLVKQRHLVLVSLLLFNFLADECLPLFLDNLMPSWLAVLTSVFLVVFVSEIVPSAVFIGPDQLRLASKISPFAYVVIFVFYPIAYPISKLLDWLLQGEDELGNIYNRGELSALVRLQYEGRLAAKRRELAERRKEQHDINMLRDDASQVSDLPSVIMSTTDETWHLTEINMIDGALNLKTTTARDVCTKLRKAYTIPHDMILDQANMARIYGTLNR